MSKRVHALPWVLAGLLALPLTPGVSRALSISDFQFLAGFDLDGTYHAPPPPGSPVGATEAIAVRQDDPTFATVWFTGVDKSGTGNVYVREFEVVSNTQATLTPVAGAPPVDHGFGKNAEGLAFTRQGDEERLLISNAPDKPKSSSGVYVLPVDGPVVGPVAGAPKFVPSPATRVEGLAIDPAAAASGTDPQRLWLVDEGEDEAFEFDLTLAGPSTQLLSSFGTDDDPIDIDASGPEGITFFGDDLILVDDGGDGKPGRLIQVTMDGKFVDEIATDGKNFDPFPIYDPQGIDFVRLGTDQDPIDLIFVINDRDKIVHGDGPAIVVLAKPGFTLPTTSTVGTHTPEPRAALLFAAQALVVAYTMRLRRRSAGS